MLIRLHKKATTTPAIRDHISTCGKPIKTLARELNLNVATVRKWRNQADARDAFKRPHNLQATLTRPQELLVQVSRYFFEYPYGKKLAKNYATANACSAPMRPRRLVSTQQGDRDIGSK